MSNEYLFQMQAMKNIETFKHFGAKKIIVSCLDIGLKLETFRMAISERQPAEESFATRTRECSMPQMST
jgi:tRNA-binding EMAP/Myf-like protein